MAAGRRCSSSIATRRCRARAHGTGASRPRTSRRPAASAPRTAPAPGSRGTWASRRTATGATSGAWRGPPLTSATSSTRRCREAGVSSITTSRPISWWRRRAGASRAATGTRGFATCARRPPAVSTGARPERCPRAISTPPSRALPSSSSTTTATASSRPAPAPGCSSRPPTSTRATAAIPRSGSSRRRRTPTRSRTAT